MRLLARVGVFLRPNFSPSGCLPCTSCRVFVQQRQSLYRTLITPNIQSLLLSARHFTTMPPKQSSKSNTSEDKTLRDNKADSDAQPHQYQAGSSTNREEDEWKHREPYRIHEDDENFDAKWKGKCHCGKVQYQLSRDKPLAAKYCHCTTCQRLHGAPFQWAAIFHKSDINFTRGHHDLGWYDPTEKSVHHHLPCKVSCAYCRTPIMDEGRNMILLYPSLIEDIHTKKGHDAFRPTCHMFYSQRVVDFKGDGIVKWKGLDNSSDMIDDDGDVMVEYKEGMKAEDMDEQKRKKIKLHDETKERERKKDQEQNHKKAKDKTDAGNADSHNQ